MAYFKMRYFIYDYFTDESLIDSFLKSSSLAHKQEKKSKDWFNWKFRDNPFGESIMACAEVDNKIVGCVAYGIQEFWLNGRKIKGVLSFETFVHPVYQGGGVFSKLIKLAEEAVKSNGIDLMINFPNSNSLRGFIKGGWKPIDRPEYWIKGKNLLTIPLNIKNIRLGFKPNKSNINLLKTPNEFVQNPEQLLTSVITLDYLKWRFFSYPVTEYIIIDTKEIYSVIRKGTRGNLREGQVLFIQVKNSDSYNMAGFIKDCHKKANFDILSFSITKTNKIRKSLRNSFFLRVPNKTNICYKILNEAIIKDGDVMNISLSAINYHTY